MSSSLAGRAIIPSPARGLVAFIGATLLVAACGLLDDLGPQAKVTLYGRNALAAEAWFDVRPMPDPPESVGFGRDIGVACFEVPIGSELVKTDGAPSLGGRVTKVIATLDDPLETFWVDVAADGSLTAGEGVPAWWTGEPQVC